MICRKEIQRVDFDVLRCDLLPFLLGKLAPDSVDRWIRVSFVQQYRHHGEIAIFVLVNEVQFHG